MGGSGSCFRVREVRVPRCVVLSGCSGAGCELVSVSGQKVVGMVGMSTVRGLGFKASFLLSVGDEIGFRVWCRA